MTGELREAIEGAVDRVDPGRRRVSETADRTSILSQLSGADYISLSALFVGWVSALLFVRGEANLALVAMVGAFGLDKLDGWYARYTETSSEFGRQIDSFVDVFAYLVPAVLLFRFTLSPHVLASLVVGFLILAFGGLRLVRHNSEGFGTDEDVSFYHGTTVVHTNLLVVANYFLAAFVGVWSGWGAALTIAVACPLMVSDYKAYKSDVSHALAGISAATVCGLALTLEFGVV